MQSATQTVRYRSKKFSRFLVTGGVRVSVLSMNLLVDISTFLDMNHNKTQQREPDRTDFPVIFIEATQSLSSSMASLLIE